jgi:hypothetical protein
MLSLADFLSLLPGIRPRLARRLILDGPLLTPDQRRDIRMRDRNVLDTVLEVGPDAAAAIDDAYVAGNLSMQKGVLPLSAIPEVEAYLADAPRHRREIAERRRLDQAVRDPSVLKESDLEDYRLLEQLFFALKGAGSGTLELAGIPVTKSLVGYSSNSGKTTGWRVTYSWTGSDGRARFLEKTPLQASNRWNDPERDWGLHD